MSIWKSGVDVGYYWGIGKTIVFKESWGSVTSEATYYPSLEKKLFPLDPSVFQLGSVKGLSNKKAVRLLLKEGYRPQIRDKKIVFVKSIWDGDKIKLKLIAKLTQAIEKLRLQIIEEDDEIPDHLLCPIGHTLMRDPVSVDDELHTFERGNIEKHLEQNKSCPTCRAPIQLPLKPNRRIKEEAEQRKATVPIPILPLMLGKPVPVEDAAKVQKLMETAELFVQSDLKHALGMYSTAFNFTNRWQDFEHLPVLLASHKQPLKAALAYLYLAKLQLEQDVPRALDNLSKALELVPEDEALQVAYAYGRRLAKQTTEASDAFQKIAQNLFKAGKVDAAFVHSKKAVILTPERFSLYQQMDKMYEEERLARVYLFGFLQMLRENPQEAQRFYDKALALTPSRPFVHLAYLCSLPKADAKKIPLYRKLGEIYSSRNEPSQALSFFRKATRSKQDEDLRAYIQALSLSQQWTWKDTAETVYLKWIDRLFPKGAEVALEAIERLGRRLPLLERLLKIYVENSQLEKLEPLIAEVGKLQEYNSNASAAMATYLIGYEKLHLYESGMQLARLYSLDKQTQKSLHLYADLSTQAYESEELDKVARCMQEIRRMDPAWTSFSTQEKQGLLAQHIAAKQAKQLTEQAAKIKELEETLAILQKELQLPRKADKPKAPSSPALPPPPAPFTFGFGSSAGSGFKFHFPASNAAQSPSPFALPSSASSPSFWPEPKEQVPSPFEVKLASPFGWRLEKSIEKQTIPGTFAMLSNGLVACAAADHILLLDPALGVIGRIPAKGVVALSPLSEQRFVGYCQDNSITIWSAKQKEIKFLSIQGPSDITTILGLDNHFAVSTKNGDIILYNLLGQEVLKMSSRSHFVCKMARLQEDRIVCGYSDGNVRIYDTDFQLVVAEEQSFSKPIQTLAVQGKTTAISDGSSVLIWSLDSSVKYNFKYKEGSLSALAFMQPAILAGLGSDQHVNIWNIVEKIRLSRQPLQSVHSLLFTGDKLITAGSNFIQIWS